MMMETAQDYLNETASGQMRGGFNSRLYGESHSESLRFVPSGYSWGQRSAGWGMADEMIRDGKIFSKTKVSGVEITFKCYLDGDKWCCVGEGFEDLQSSNNFAFGDTFNDAIIKFSKMEFKQC